MKKEKPTSKEQPAMEKNLPHFNVNLNVKRKDGGDPKEGQAALRNFSESLSSTEDGKQPRSTKSPLEELPEIPQPKLSSEQIDQLREIETIDLRRGRLDLANLDRQLKIRENAYEVMKRIERSLKPMRMLDLLFNGYLLQEVNLSEDITLAFSTYPGSLEINIIDAAAKYVGEVEEKGSKIFQNSKNNEMAWVMRLAMLSCGLINISGAEMPGKRILFYFFNNKEKSSKVTEMIVQGITELQKKPVELLGLLADHHAAFKMRVREIVSNTGYMENEVKK